MVDEAKNSFNNVSESEQKVSNSKYNFHKSYLSTNFLHCKNCYTRKFPIFTSNGTKVIPQLREENCRKTILSWGELSSHIASSLSAPKKCPQPNKNGRKCSYRVFNILLQHIGGHHFDFVVSRKHPMAAAFFPDLPGPPLALADCASSSEF